MDDDVVFICDNKTIQHIISELSRTDYNIQTESACILIEYTVQRKKCIPLYTTRTIYKKLEKELKAEQFQKFGSCIKTKQTQEADNHLNEIIALIRLLKIDYKDQRFILISDESKIEKEKVNKIKSEGVQEILSIDKTADYIRGKPDMQRYIDSVCINPSS